MWIIGLKENQEEWKFHRFHTKEELHHALQARYIAMGKDVIISPYVMLGNGAYIADKVCLHDEVVVDENASVSKAAVLKRGAVVSAGAKVGQEAVLGTNSFMDAHAVVGRACVLGDDTEMGRDTVLGQNVKVGPRTVIHDRTVIGGNVEVGEHVWIGKDSRVDENVRIYEEARILDNVNIRPHTTIWPEQRVNSFSSVSYRSTEKDKIQQMETQRAAHGLYFDKINVINMGETQFLRVKHEGAWLPMVNLNKADWQNLESGRVTERTLANKYLMDYIVSQQSRTANLGR